MNLEPVVKYIFSAMHLLNFYSLQMPPQFIFIHQCSIWSLLLKSTFRLVSIITMERIIIIYFIYLLTDLNK